MKKLYITALAALTLAACQVKDVAKEDVFFLGTEEELKAELDKENAEFGYIIYDEANGGLNAFVAAYSTEKGNYWSDSCQYRTRANNEGVNPGLWVFSIDTIPEPSATQPAVYIRGRITTDDYGGNFYKALVMQQMVGGVQHALRLSVDAGNANGQYPQGQELLIRVNGFAIGRYANQPQLCVPTYNNNIYAQNAGQKVGWAPGRIPPARFRAATRLIGLPDKSKLHYDDLNLADLVTATGSDGGATKIDAFAAREWDGRLVRLSNIHFTGEYANTNGSRVACTTGDPEKDTNANVFGPTTQNVNYPQGRVITNGSLFTLISTSEYAKYAHMYLPEAEYIGTTTGILGFYMDNAGYKATWKTWSISLCDLQQGLELYKTDAEGNTFIWTPEEYHATPIEPEIGG